MKTKKATVVVTLLIIALLFIIGADWAGETVRRLFHGYFADVAIPFGFYMLLVLVEEDFKPFKKWYAKAGAVFLLCALSECLQYFGIFALASVFDRLDYLMYALGAVLAAFVDRIIFRRMLSFWTG